MLIIMVTSITPQSGFAAYLFGLGADQRGSGKELNSYWSSATSSQPTSRLLLLYLLTPLA